jgi:pyridoxine/pyridoxamine 5'-phosphate oxidase
MNFNNKSEILKRANFLLKDGVKNRGSMFHTPVISSLNEKEISSRVMVLRDHIASKRVIRFHSDFRSDKVRELKDNKTISVIGYDPNLKTQSRLTGKAKINHMNKSSKKAWEESQAISKKCYSVKDGSSTQMHKPELYDFHMKDISVEDGYENFCTIEIYYESLEFLYLQRQGHRRCKFKWNSKGKLQSFWLVP